MFNTMNNKNINNGHIKIIYRIEKPEKSIQINICCSISRNNTRTFEKK